MNPSRPSRWLRWLKRLVFVAVGLVTLVALVLAIEGYRAKRAWLACEQELKAQGEELHWVDLASPPVPDDQNFLAAPVLAGCFNFGSMPAEDPSKANPCDQLLENLSWASNLPGPGDWREGTVIALEEWQAKLRADPDEVIRSVPERYGIGPAVAPPQPERGAHPAATSPAWTALLARPPGTPLEDLRFLLNYDQAVLDAIRAGARRPFARLDLAIDAPPDVFTADLMPQLARLKSLVRSFRASCWTELVGGNPEAALADFETMLALGDAAGSQPLLISQLVKIAIIDVAVAPLWAGLAEHRWSDSELAKLEEALEHLNMVADMQHALRGERAFGLSWLFPFSGTADEIPAEAAHPMRKAMRFWPSAVIYRNRINLARAYQAVLIDRIDPSRLTVRLTPTAQDQALRQQFGRYSLYNVFTPQLLPAVEKSLENAAKSQVTVTLARVACALERFYLANDTYPEDLGELTPRFIAQLPPDPINGEALRYRREAPGHFAVYSVGLNGRDDGGVPASRKPTGAYQDQQGDLVWRSLPSQQSP